MTGGALVAPPGASSIAGSRLPTPAPAVRGASAARARSEGRMVRRGTSRPAGSPSVPAPRSVDLDGRSRCDTNQPEAKGQQSSAPGALPHAERRTAAAWSLGDVRPLSGDDSGIQGDRRDDVPNSKVTSRPARDTAGVMEEVTLEVTSVRKMRGDQGASSWYRTEETPMLTESTAANYSRTSSTWT